MAETKKKVTKKDTKTAKKETKVTKKVTEPETKKEDEKIITVKAVQEAKKLTSEAAFSVWVDVLILIFIVLMFAVVLYGYIIAK